MKRTGRSGPPPGRASLPIPQDRSIDGWGSRGRASQSYHAGAPRLGQADKVDRDALAWLVSPISRFLTPEQVVAATVVAAGGEVAMLAPTS